MECLDDAVVDRDASDRVDPLGLERGGLVDIAGQVALRTGRGEGAGHREERHLLAAEQLVGADFLGAFGAENPERARGDFVANLDGHLWFLWNGGSAGAPRTGAPRRWGRRAIAWRGRLSKPRLPRALA